MANAYIRNSVLVLSGPNKQEVVILSRTKELHADLTETARTALASCTDPTETASKAREPTSQIGSSIPQNDILSQIQLDDVQAESRNESVEEDIKVARTMLR